MGFTIEKKGISSIIVTVLLIVITMVIAGIVGGFVVNMIHNSGVTVKAMQACNNLGVEATRCYLGGNSLIPHKVIVKRSGNDPNVIVNKVDLLFSYGQLTTKASGMTSSGDTILEQKDSKEYSSNASVGGKTPEAVKAIPYISVKDTDVKDYPCPPVEEAIICQKNPEAVILTNNAPFVQITSPANGSNFNSGDTVNLSASASDSDGNIEFVKFYYGTTIINTANSSPYIYSWNVGSLCGIQTLSAAAEDDDGAETISQPITIFVNCGGSGSGSGSGTGLSPEYTKENIIIRIYCSAVYFFNEEKRNECIWG